MRLASTTLWGLAAYFSQTGMCEVNVSAEHLFQQAQRHHQAGQLPQAEALYRQILAAEPRHAGAVHFLGVLAHQVGRNDVALDLMRQAVALAPGHAGFQANLGELYRHMGRLDEAIGACQAALRLQPGFAKAHGNLGNLLKDAGRMEEAVAAYREALRCDPGYAEAYCNMGIALQENGAVDEAIASFQKAIALRPQMAEAYCNLGNALTTAGRTEEAVTACREALRLRSDYADGWNNLGAALQQAGRIAEAKAAYERAVHIKPDYAMAHWNSAVVELLTGNFTRGWQGYEWRFKHMEREVPPRAFGKPMWDGGDLGGRTLLVHAEQGFGDSIQFVRFVSRAAQRARRVVLECPGELRNLLAKVKGVGAAVALGEALPEFDCHLPLLSLPFRLQTGGDVLACEVPYLHPDPAKMAAWKNRLAAPEFPGRKVGLAWAGNSYHKNDRNRSMPLQALAPLAQVPGVTWVSLQKGPAGIQAHHASAGLRLVDFTDELHDFEDTAALVASLDLVIAVDTAVLHLAGALARPAWGLICFAPDWRWLLGCTGSPWYPTVRLFRQPRAGDWQTSLEQIVEALQKGEALN